MTMTHPSLFDELYRAGGTLEEEDIPRVGRQMAAVLGYMRDHKPHTLAEIASAVNASEPSVSARIRDLTNKLGLAYTRTRDPERPGIHWYRLDDEVPVPLVTALAIVKAES